MSAVICQVVVGQYLEGAPQYRSQELNDGYSGRLAKPVYRAALKREERQYEEMQYHRQPKSYNPAPEVQNYVGGNNHGTYYKAAGANHKADENDYRWNGPTQAPYVLPPGQYTPEVQEAREIFFKQYQQQLALAKKLGYDGKGGPEPPKDNYDHPSYKNNDYPQYANNNNYNSQDYY